MYGAGPVRADGKGNAVNAHVVSVVIATHERPELMRRAVASVLAQRDVEPLEILLVFDGVPHGVKLDAPTDLDTGQHVVRAMHNTRSRGLAGARNTGILTATAPFIAFCDDDDEWKPDKLSTQLALMEDPDVRLVATGIEIHSAGGIHARPAPPVVHFEDLLRSRITELHPSSFLLRTEALRQDIGLVDEELPASYGEDYDLLLRVARHGRIVADRACHTIVHWDRSSYFSEKWKGIAEGLHYLLDKHPEFATSDSGRARIEGQIAFAYAALGSFGDARRWARKALGHDLFQARAYLAMLVGLRALKGEYVVATLNRRGKGM